ncbi:putative cereblon [Carpediemonas membranifera]|uniref:Putative cereblon n=1 Tax=Carpediemonas membranifera TaxID=201153 RepID=A0A8J6ATC7_9EUKA|nr:putative cereblon [Carpediemonas membranifera]|eukprot:KAG9394066.1 putative cereblon [Carpediemonas membranifera]
MRPCFVERMSMADEDHAIDESEHQEIPNEPLIPCLCCSHCKKVIALADDIIAERHTVLTSNVYPYELEVLGRDIFCYSATNPSDYRFDLMRIRPVSTITPPFAAPINRKFVLTSSDLSDELSWFPPFLWSMAWCWNCLQHIGWGFIEEAKEGADQTPNPAFLALIFTRLTPLELPISEILESGEDPNYFISDLEMHERVEATYTYSPRFIDIASLIEMLSEVGPEMRAELLRGLHLDDIQQLGELQSLFRAEEDPSFDGDAASDESPESRSDQSDAE